MPQPTQSNNRMASATAKQGGITFMLLVTMMMMMGRGTAMDILTIVQSNTPISADVSYSCKLHNLWTPNRHPVGYPRSAHWTVPVMVAHSSAYVMWQQSGFSSRGMEQLAELGSTSTLLNEINRSGSATGVPVTGTGQYDDVQTLPSVIVTPNHHLISVATMAGPSPDWFTGFSNFDARNLNSGTWWRQFVVETYMWDAGTEQGSTFSLSNPPESPHRPISRHTRNTFPNNGQILPVARFECSLEASPTIAPVTQWRETPRPQQTPNPRPPFTWTFSSSWTPPPPTPAYVVFPPTWEGDPFTAAAITTPAPPPKWRTPSWRFVNSFEETTQSSAGVMASFRALLLAYSVSFALTLLAVY